MNNNTVHKVSGKYLQHWYSDGCLYHVSARLVDSIPFCKIRQWNQEKWDIIDQAKRQDRSLTEIEIQRLNYLFSDKIDKYLDQSKGVSWLRDCRIARIVSESIEYYHEKQYELHAYCVMPNHIHMIIGIRDSSMLSRMVWQLLKYTAREANRLLGRNGSFWQHESYDHIIRSTKEYIYQVKYVYGNSDKANMQSWPWRKLDNDLYRKTVGDFYSL